MNVLLDTSVLAAASVRQHPHFARADEVMRRCVEGEMSAIVNTHGLLDFHSALTQLPGGLAVPPHSVRAILQEGILPYVRCVSLDPAEIQAVQNRAGELGLIGGIIYDLYHLAVAEREGVDRLYTFNIADFRRLARPDFADRIVAP